MSAESSLIASGMPASTGALANGRSKKRLVGASRRSGVDARKPANLSRATIAATDDFDFNPSNWPIDAYDGSARWRE
jgi:hypothetical protein